MFASKIFFDYMFKAHDIKGSIEKKDRQIKKAQREEKKYSTRIDDAKQRDGQKIDLINTIILRKSFSWIELLSDIENSLPDSSYITSLVPTLSDDLRMKLRIRVISPDVNDLLKFIQNLRDLNFDKIEIKSEAKKEGGNLLSEISLNYEKRV
jgi:hypothetical protein